MKYNKTHSGRVLNKVNFWDVFVPSWNSSITPKNIILGFKKTGVYPHDPEVKEMIKGGRAKVVKGKVKGKGKVK